MGDGVRSAEPSAFWGVAGSSMGSDGLLLWPRRRVSDADTSLIYNYPRFTALGLHLGFPDKDASPVLAFEYTHIGAASAGRLRVCAASAARLRIDSGAGGACA